MIECVLLLKCGDEIKQAQNSASTPETASCRGLRDFKNCRVPSWRAFRHQCNRAAQATIPLSRAAG